MKQDSRNYPAATGSRPTKEAKMTRNKVSFLFPFLSLLLFLVLSFLRCADSDVARDPMMPVLEQSEEVLPEIPGAPIGLPEDNLVRTTPEEFLSSSDVRIVPSRLDRMNSQKLWFKIPDAKVYLFDFGPEGQKFKRPCRIEVDLSKADLSQAELRKIKVYYLGDKRLEDVPSMLNKRTGKMVFWVKHFSRYALSRE